MVRNYKRKTDKDNYSDGQLHMAIQSVLGGKSCKSAAIEFGIPRSTLQKKVKEFSEGSAQENSNRSKGFLRTFNDEQEEALARYILEMENKFIGLSGGEVRKLAFEYATKLGVPHRFNIEKQEAGKDWLHDFMKRHEFSHRKPEHTSSARANGFNKEAVEKFFLLLKSILNDHQLTPDRIYNVDETGISVVPKTSPKILAKKGRRQVGGLISCERGETVTAEICISAAGTFMPPMLIFPRVKENLEFLVDAPPGAWAAFHKSGYMQTNIFTKWFEKFITFSHSTPENPVLLLLDGHATHIKNLKVIDLAKENGVIILCFPPHCTHKMQPLDVGFNGPLNISFGKEVAAFQRQGNRVILKNLFSIFGKAFIQVAKMETAINSFRKCGIYPFNCEVFSELDSILTVTSLHSHNLEAETRIKELEDLLKNSTQEASNITNDVNHNQGFNIGEQGEVKIRESYIFQAKHLINLLSSCISDIESKQNQFNGPHTHNFSSLDDADESGYFDKCNNNPVTTENKTKTTKRKKGQAAIITSDQYKENLIAEKIKNIKKEKVNEQIKSGIKSNKVKSDSFKRKQTFSYSNQSKKLRMPLQDSSQVNLVAPSEALNLLADNVHSPQNNCIQVPSDSLVLDSDFYNSEEVEIFYVDEETARSLNIL